MKPLLRESLETQYSLASPGLIPDEATSYLLKDTFCDFDMLAPVQWRGAYEKLENVPFTGNSAPHKYEVVLQTISNYFPKSCAYKSWSCCSGDENERVITK